MTTPPPKRPWYRLIPAQFFLGLLVVQVFLFLSERFQWFAFNERKGWTVLIAVGAVGVTVVVILVWCAVGLLVRRRVQFGIRSLLLFLLAASLPLGWLAWQMQRAGGQREAIREIGPEAYLYDYRLDENFDLTEVTEPATPAWLREMLGDDFFCDVAVLNCTFVSFDDKDAEHLKRLSNLRVLWLDCTQISDKGLTHVSGMTQLVSLRLLNTQISDNGLRHLKEMTRLEELRLADTQITDAGLEHLKGLTKLRWLLLQDTQVTDSGLEQLEGLTRLEELYFGGTQVADMGVEYLKELTNLERLDLSSTQVTDAGLEHLKGLTSLDVLWLANTQVTDDGLEHLRELGSLMDLNLSVCPVSDEGVQKLQQALPHCEIIR